MPRLPLGDKPACRQIPAVNQGTGAPLSIAANPGAARLVVNLRLGVSAALAGRVRVEVVHDGFLVGHTPAKGSSSNVTIRPSRE